MLCLLAFIAGALCAPLLSPELLGPSGPLLFLAALALSIWLLLRRSDRFPLFGTANLAAGFALLGSAVAVMGITSVVDAQIDESWQGRDVKLRGQIVEVIDQTETISRVHFRVEAAEPERLEQVLKNRLVRLSWYYGEPLGVDQHWRITARLKRPRGFVNPRSFDYAAWLLSKELVATGYIKDGVRLNAERQGSWSLGRLREALAARIFAQPNESDPFFRALLLGDTNDISSEQWRIFQRTGTIHLITISGLHVGLVAALGFMLGWGLVRLTGLVRLGHRSLLVCRWLPPSLAFALSLSYSVLAGFSIPTQRAMVVVALANVALVAGVKMSPLRLLALACVLVLLTSPLAPTQTGFWLSFLAVFVLILGFGGRQLRLHPASSLTKAQWLLTIGLLAPLLGLGQTISAVGPLANLVAVPVVSALVVPGLLIAALLVWLSPALTATLVNLLDLIFNGLWQFLCLLSDLDFALWWPGFATSSGLVAALACGCLLLLLPRGLYLRWLGGLLIGLALLAPRAPDPPLTLTVLEVGQGLAVWVHTPGYNLLYDTGPAFSADFDAGSRIVVPFLRTRGVHRLDTLIVSHGDKDHSGGLAGVLANMPSNRLLLGDPLPVQTSTDTDACVQGQEWQSGQVRFRMLWPPPDSHYSGNNNSCVLLLELGQQRILLTGDIEAEVEQQLLAEGRLPRDVTLLIAPHHGSKTSSTAEFVAVTNSEAVVFSAGYRSRFGHPHGDVVERYRRIKAQTFNTGEQGAISFRWASVDSPPWVEKARIEIDRAWY